MISRNPDSRAVKEVSRRTIKLRIDVDVTITLAALFEVLLGSLYSYIQYEGHLCGAYFEMEF